MEDKNIENKIKAEKELSELIVELAKKYVKDIEFFEEIHQILLKGKGLPSILDIKEIEEIHQILIKGRSISDIKDIGEFKSVEEINELINLPKTCYPGEYISAKAKVNNLLFDGELTEQMQLIGTEGLDKKELTVKASIDLEELKGIELSNKNITSYDREVHDSIVSLYVDGGNQYITPLMIYRTMTGNPKAKFSPNGKNLNDILESIERCSKTRVYIDATDEVKAKGYNIEQPILKENLIYTRSISGIYNGEVSEWIEVLATPVLYKYANSKNQVARMDIKLLNTPVNKNKENIELQGYLRERVQTMKGSKLSRNIRYETVYKRLNVNTETYKKVRDKQGKIRGTIKEILNYWKEEDFIKDFKENSGPRNSKESITIIL